MKHLSALQLTTKRLLLLVLASEMFILFFLLDAHFSSKPDANLQDLPTISNKEQLLKQSILAVETAYAQTIDISMYSRSPYFLPTPSGSSDRTYSDEDINQYNKLGGFVAKHQSYLTSKAPKGDAKYVDPFLSVIWTGAIEGIGDNPYFWNCRDSVYDINAGCSGGYYSGGWQVGWGIQVSQATSHLADDFNEVHGSGASADATKVQQAGQAVIDSSGGKITNPSTFPQKTIVTLASEAGQGNTSSQQAIAILLLDPELGAIAISREIAGDIAARDNWAGTMAGWGSYYSSNLQNFSNRMKAIADKYTGVAGSSSGGTGGSGTATLTLKVKPLPAANNSYLINMATAQVSGGSGTGSSQSSVTSPDGKHACPVNAQFQSFQPGGYAGIGQSNTSWICEHCHDSNTFRSIDMGTYPGGGTPVVALVSGTATKFDDGRSIALEGDDDVLYFYTHMAERSIPDGSTKVTMGQPLGTVAAAGAPGSANNNVAHLHIQGTTNNDHFHPNIYMGPLLDEWCGVDVCQGKQQTSCGF